VKIEEVHADGDAKMLLALKLHRSVGQMSQREIGVSLVRLGKPTRR
jgi:hypothetical protein